MAEEHGRRVKEISEYRTSTRYIRCGSEKVVHAGRLFKCLTCGSEAHRDNVGVLNMANLYDGGIAIRVVAHITSEAERMRWEPKRV